MVAGWMFGGVGCHTTSKAADLSYRLGYLITAALFHLVCPVCPDIIRISWISMLRGHYLHFVDLHFT